MSYAAGTWRPMIGRPRWGSRIPCGRAKAAPAPCGSSRLWLTIPATRKTQRVLSRLRVHRTRLRWVPQIRRRQARSPSHVPCPRAGSGADTRSNDSVLAVSGAVRHRRSLAPGWDNCVLPRPSPVNGRVKSQSRFTVGESPHGPTKSPCRRALLPEWATTVAQSLVGPAAVPVVLSQESNWALSVR